MRNTGKEEEKKRKQMGRETGNRTEGDNRRHKKQRKIERGGCVNGAGERGWETRKMRE